MAPTATSRLFIFLLLHFLSWKDTGGNEQPGKLFRALRAKTAEHREPLQFRVFLLFTSGVAGLE